MGLRSSEDLFCDRDAVLRTDQRKGLNMIGAKASLLTGTILLFAIVMASLAALGIGWIASSAGFSEHWVGLVACLTWSGVLIAIFGADALWRMKNNQ